MTEGSIAKILQCEKSKQLKQLWQLPQEDSVEQATAYICGTYCGRPEDLNAGAAVTIGQACIY